MSKLGVFEQRLRDVIDRQICADLVKQGAFLPVAEVDHLVDLEVSRLGDVLLIEYGRGIET